MMIKSQLLQDRSHQYQKGLLNNKSGSAILVLLTWTLIFISIPFSFYIMESSVVMEEKRHIERGIVVSALAALKDVDEESIAYGTVEMNKEEAALTFKKYLNKNLNLDVKGVPQGRLIKDPIEITELTIYSDSDLPDRCSYGVMLKRASIHVVAKTRIKRSFYTLKFGDYIDIVIHKDVDIYTKN